MALLAALLAACATGGGDAPAPAARDRAPFPEASAPGGRGGRAPAPVARLRGFLRLRGERFAFTPCAEERALPLADRTGGELERTYRALAPGPGARVYVELRARREEGAPGGTAAWAALELRRAAYESAGCAEEPEALRFAARGNEPFWRVEVLAARIRLSEPGRERGFALHSLERRGEEGAAVHVARGGGEEGPALELVLIERRCVDSMSGERFPYAARLRVDGRELEGCAHEGPAAPPG